MSQWAQAPGIGRNNAHKEPLGGRSPWLGRWCVQPVGLWLSERVIALPVENIIVVSNMLPFLFIGTGIGKCNATGSL